MTATAAAPTLHMPEEPAVPAERWLSAILEGAVLDDVLESDEGLVDWLWARWRILASAGMTRDDLALVVTNYQREIWLWLAGERTWAQCCSGLIGRIGRRLGEHTEG
jgi:hypothetical protein